MSNIPPIEDGCIDSVIKSSGPLKPNLNKTQGVELRALVKLLRDRLEGEISDHYASNQAALSEKANLDQVVLKTTKVNGKPLYGDITLDKNDVGLDNVNNTSDLDKPLSSFAQAALALKADMVDVNDKLSLKVDKVSGKQLSTEDFSSAEKDKLTAIQNGATANESNAYLLAREHHTGTQAIETVFGLRSELDDKLNRSEKGQGNGIATLDVNGKIPLSQLNEAILGSVNYQGNYDAAINSPSLPAAAGNKGKYYVVAVAGNQQGLEFSIGDWIISNGDIWQRVDNNNKVTSVNGRQGAVVLGKADIGLNNTDNTSDYNKPISAAQQIALDNKANSNGSNASGIWAINITGNADTVTALNRPQVFAVINGSDLTSNTLNINIFGRSAYSDKIGNGSVDMAFHWQGQGGQPNWLWGGNEPGDMYVYNPANFNVQNAIQWNGVSVNWTDNSGTNLNDLIGIDTNTGSASRYNASYIKNWLNLDSSFQPLENQRLSNTNAVQFQSVFANEYVSVPKVDFRGVANPSFIQGNGEFIDIRPSSDVRFLNIINNDTPTVVIHARDGQIDMGLLVSANIQNAGKIATGTLSLNATSQDVADIDKVLVGTPGTGDAYWASSNHFKNNVLGLGNAAYLNASGGDDAIQFSHVVKYNSSGFIRTAAKNYPQSGGLTALYGAKGEDDFFWAFNNDAVKAFLNYNGSQIYSDVSNVNADIQVSKYLRWKQHGSGHVIFDASAGTSPTGASIDRNNPQVQVDGAVNPVLMGWNGVYTYGVRVDNARIADHSLNTDKWAGLSRTAGIVNSGEIGYLHILNGSGDNSGFADRNTIKSWLGVNTENQWTLSAGDVDLNALSDFVVQESYGASANAPFGQHYNLVVNFKSPSAQRGLQLASYYGSVDHFYVRSKFDSTGQWKAWKEVVTHDQLNLQLITNEGSITNQPIGVNMYDGQPASTISLAIGDNDTGFQRGGDGVTGYYSNSNLLYNLNDPASIRNFLNLNTNQDPIFRNLTANEAHLNKIWSYYGEASVNNYSWTDAAFTTTSIEIVTSGNNTYTDKAPTLAFHRYGSGGPQFRLDPTGTNILYLESANVNSSRNGIAYGGGNNNYFNKLVIDGGLKVNSTLELPGSTMNSFLAGNGDNATYDIHNFKLKGWWGLGLQAYDDVVRGVYDFRRGLWDTESGYKVHSNIHVHSPRFGLLGGEGSQLNYAQGQIVLGGHFINGTYELPTDSVNNGGALITSDIFGTVRLTTIASIGNGTIRNISPETINQVSKIFTFGVDGVFTSNELSTTNIYLNRGQETPGNIDKFAVGQTGDNVVRWTPVSSIVSTLGLQSGGFNDATRLQSTTHAGTFWLENNWDGTYWQLHSNHGSPVNVGRANTAGTADASNYVNCPDGSRQPNDIFPQNNPNRVRFDFSNAVNVGVGGNYAGVMTYSPWSGTTASTGDASYQLIFGSTGPNAEGVPMLRIRKGIDTSWNGFYDIYTSADIGKVRNDLGLGASAYEATTLQQAYNRGNSVIGSLNIACNNTADIGFNSAGLVIREGNMGGAAQSKPRLSFHWSGVVASQLMLESDGAVSVFNNPGTGYEKFRASSIGGYELRSINTRSDGGLGKIDFADIGIGYNLSAKYWTFWNGAGEHYGITNDYSGTGAQLSIIAAQAGGNIRFYSGMDNGTNRGIERLSIESNGDVYVKGYTYFHGDIKIGHNQGASRITMGDVDEQQRDIHCNSNRIGFLNAGGGWGAYCNNDGGWISDNYIGGGRVFAGFDSGIAGSVNASNWFRSNGASGWYNETFGGGIFMSDSTWVRVHGNKGFWAENSARFLDNITIDKSGSYGTLTFGISPNSNDPAFIRHFETPNGGNNGRMEFSVSDDIGDNDYFSFGSTAGGSFQETIRFTTVGNAKFNGAVNASGGFYDTSDKRLKTETSEVFDARSIKAYTYFKNEQLETGYYAQDVELLMPHAIKQDNNGFLSLNYTQVLVAKVANLEEDVKRLQEEINFLKQGI